MKLLFAASRNFLLFAIVLVAVDASALTLGRLRGPVILGQPLQVSIPVQIGEDEKVTASCFFAEVSYGELRQEAQSVSVNADIKEDGLTGLVRIRGNNRVDEPVVTVTLFAGCEQRTSRRYVLLSDLPSENVGSAGVERAVEVPATLPNKREPSIALSVPAPAPLVTASSLPAKSNSGVEVGSKTERPQKAMKAASLESSPGERISKTRPDSRNLKAKPRLKLAPWDLGPERDPVLKSTDSLLFLEPLENLQKRAEAVAAWRALNTTAEEVLRQDARSQAVEGDLKTLKDLTVRNQQALADITERLQQAERERFANPLVYVLVVLLLVLAAAVALLWNRLRESVGSAGPWWRPGADAHVSIPVEAVPHAVASPPESVAGEAATVAHAAPSSLQSRSASEVSRAGPVEVDVLLGESVFSNLTVEGESSLSSRETVPAAVQVVPPASLGQRESKDFGASVSGALRAINTREMLDVRQQAEFFMTLGQYEEAISVLADSIKSSDSANPMVYLDLLKIFHTLSRKEEYDKYREEFNREFSGRVPVYVGFSQGGKPLEAYPDIVSRIESLWPTDACMGYLESCLVRNPDEDPDSGLDLEAFRDLLLLHGVLRRLDDLLESAMVPFSAVRQTPSLIDKVAVTTMPVVAQTEMESSAVDLELELDLSGAETPANNLIDFDVSGFSKSAGSSKDS